MDFTLEYVKGNLFSSPDEISLVHCVSKDLKMGQGIAAQFKNIFGDIDSLKNQNCTVGEVAYLRCQTRFIFNLVTKDKFFHKPTYDDLRTSLNNLRLLCERYNITKLSMPKIGCGLDKLYWPSVENIIKNVFTASKIHIYVYIL